MKKLVIISDDFGLSSGTNEGSVEAAKDARGMELSLMMNYPRTEEAISLAHKNKIRLGIHLTLQNYNQTQKYLRTSDYEQMLISMSAKELETQVRSELDLFKKMCGYRPTHITSHQHTHLHPKISPVLSKYAVEHDIYVRRWKEAISDEEVKTSDHFFGYVWGTLGEVKKNFLADLATVKDGESAEIMLHAGQVDDFVSQNSSMVDERERDLQLMLDSEFKQGIFDLGFKIVPAARI